MCSHQMTLGQLHPDVPRTTGCTVTVLHGRRRLASSARSGVVPFGCPLRSGIPGLRAMRSPRGSRLGLSTGDRWPSPARLNPLPGDTVHGGAVCGQGVWVGGAGTVARPGILGSLAFFLRRGRYCHFPRDNTARGSPGGPRGPRDFLKIVIMICMLGEKHIPVEASCLSTVHVSS